MKPELPEDKDKDEKDKEEPGILGWLLLLFIVIFYKPILWVASKVTGNGPAAAFGALGIGILVVGTILILVLGAMGIGIGIYLYNH